MSIALQLSTAAILLATSSEKHHLRDDLQFLLAEGAAGRIPVYWKNSLQVASRLMGFHGDATDRTTDAFGHLQLTTTDLRRLELEESVDTSLFQPSAADYDALDYMGNDEGFRVVIGQASVKVSRDQLFVYEAAVLALGKALKATMHEPKPTATGNPRKSKSKKQPNAITELIREAMITTKSSVPDVVWCELKEMARNGRQPFSGGIQDSIADERIPIGALFYTNSETNIVSGFTKSQCKDRIRNINKAAERSAKER